MQSPTTEEEELGASRQRLSQVDDASHGQVVADSNERTNETASNATAEEPADRADRSSSSATIPPSTTMAVGKPKPGERAKDTPETSARKASPTKASRKTAECLRQAEGAGLEEGGWMGGDAWFGSVSWYV